ncbi:MAG TPA: adenylate/guanylate cyclase domain-containing protein, partial [Lysobacter sp.]|nr:adenylate/guanylate cyclase domain-containing protein [Lysobacter sp.]
MVEERTQRRLAAILAADVVGYSRLMGQDEAGTMATLKTRRKEVLEPLVARHQGRIFKVLGDGVLVEFGSAVNAVQCAVDLQQAMAATNGGEPEERHIVLRIGVNLGDVMVEGSDLYGDGVNIAARLEAIAEPGGILVSGTAHDHIGTKVKVRFEELAAQTLKNIAQSVRVYRITGTPTVVVTVTKPVSDKPSIAVLPFANMSGDPEQEFFADGLTEDIITALSRVSGLIVIARTSCFIYKDQKVDAKRVAKELNVRYIIEGSVRRAGDRVRVTAQLIDGMTGHHVWAERYDRPAGDIFDIQDDIMRSVAASTETQIQLSERLVIESRRGGELQAGELVTRAWGRFYDYTPEAFADAAEVAEQAIRLEPMNPRAHVIRARAHLNQMFFGIIPQDEANISLGLQLAQTGVRLSPRDEWAHFCLAFACELAGRIKDGVAECQRAIEINPNFSAAYAELGRKFALLGQPEQAIQACQTALRLNPRDPTNFQFHASL